MKPTRAQLGPESLLTWSQVLAELQVSEARARQLLAAVRPRRVGQGRGSRRWLWGEVLAVLPVEGQAPPRKARPVSRRVVEL